MDKTEEMQDFQKVREIIEDCFGDNSSLNLEKLITDTFDNLRDDELSDPDIIASVAERLLDEAEIGEYDAEISKEEILSGTINVSGKKYELTDETKEIDGHILYRIRALRDFGNVKAVKAGDLGGFIEKEDNLSQKGNCWVFDEATIYDEAVVSGDAMVFGKASVYGNTAVGEETLVYGNAKIYGKARVLGYAVVFGNAHICGNAKVYGDAQVYDFARVYGDAEVYDDAQVYGNAGVWGYANVYGNANVFDFARVSGDAKVCGKAIVEGNAKISEGKISEGRIDGSEKKDIELD